jgi:hypothetical protein
MRVEANVTSGLRASASDASALELVPILQAEIQKLREMLQLQQIEQQQRFKPGVIPHINSSVMMSAPDLGNSSQSRRNSHQSPGWYLIHIVIVEVFLS